MNKALYVLLSVLIGTTAGMGAVAQAHSEYIHSSDSKQWGESTPQIRLAQAQPSFPDGIQADEPLEYRANDVWQQPRTAHAQGAQLTDLLYFPPAGGAVFDVNFDTAWTTLFDKDDDPDNTNSIKSHSAQAAIEGFFALSPILALGAGGSFSWASIKMPLLKKETGTGYNPYIIMLVNPMGAAGPSPLQLQLRMQAGLLKDPSPDDNNSTYSTQRDEVLGANLGANFSLGVRAAPSFQMAFALEGRKNLIEDAGQTELATGTIMQLSFAPVFHLVAGGIFTAQWTEEAKINSLAVIGGFKLMAAPNMAFYVNGNYVPWMRANSRDETDITMKDLRARIWGMTVGLQIAI